MSQPSSQPSSQPRAVPAPSIIRGARPNTHGTASALPRALAPDVVRDLAAARDAMRGVPFSREALRAAVVRAAAGARDRGATAADVTDALEAVLAPSLVRFASPVAAELRVHVAWWAAHGYHRAD